METKVCTKCGITKKLDDYLLVYYKKSNTSYYNNGCKKCCYIHSKANLNKEKLRATRRKYNNSHKELNSKRIKERDVKWRESLSDTYIKRILVRSWNQNKEIHLFVKDITPEAIEHKRKELQFKRSIKLLMYGETKVCKQCKIEKDLILFPALKGRRISICRCCSNFNRKSN